MGLSGKVVHKQISSLSNSDLPINSPRVRSQEIIATVITNVLEVIEIINQQEKKNFKLGVIFLVIAIGTWISGLELVNSVLKGDEFQKPWFLAFLTGSCFMLNFVPEVLGFFAQLIFRRQNHSTDLSPQLSSSDLMTHHDHGQEVAIAKNADDLHKEGPVPLRKGEVLLLALYIATIYFAYNVFVMAALQYTSASNQTVLGSTTAIFTLFLGVYLGIDKFSVKKMVCVVFSLVGVVLISVSEGTRDEDGGKFKPKNPLLGNFFALIGAFCYALYLLVMKMKCGTGEKTTDERILFGWVGVFTFILGCPILIIVNALGIEEFLLPPNNRVLIMVSVNAVFSVISDYVTILAMLLTSPLITSLALTSSIPITILIDFLVLSFNEGSSGATSNLSTYIFGVGCILVSVILINLNITTENELIEEVIDDALEDAIRQDEVLSPILSPYVGSPHIHEASPRQHASIGINHLSPSLKFFRKRQGHVLSPLVPAPLLEATGLNLNSAGTDESSPLQNANHHKNLYTIDSSLEGESTATNLVVYGGVNHSFHVKMVQDNENESS